jgi:hypothetical protein
MTISLFRPSEAPVVFAQVESTGKHSALTAMALHEAVLARQAVEATGENLIVRNDWPDFAVAVRVATRQVRDEYARLLRTYGKELMVAVYGQPHEGRLRAVMLRIHQAFQLEHKPADIIRLGDAEGDFIELQPEPEPAAADDIVKRIDRAIAKGNAVSAPVLVAPPPEQNIESSELSKLNDAAVLPPGVTALGDDVDEEKPLDGALIVFLTEGGWNEPQSNAIARLSRDKGLSSITDADLATIPGVRNREAQKALRNQLNEYRAQRKAGAAL